MKIVFLCGALQPGKDGVGDYTRLLASELILRHNCETFIVSLNDQFVTDIREEIQICNTVSISILRLPGTQSWEGRIAKAKQWIDHINPEWLSLQYVLYSFHPKGLPFKFAKLVQQIGQGRRWHIMFHELWIGIKRDAPASHYVYGVFQKRIIKSLINRLSPVYITISNRIYQMELKEIGSKASLLMLFSNIPVQKPDEAFIESIYNNLSHNVPKSEYYLLGTFGSLSEVINYEEVLRSQLSIAAQMGKQMAFIQFGRSGSAAKLEELKKILGNEIDFVSLGELSDQQVSSVLQILDVGISSTPKEYVGKSGVYAAMRLHKLPVLLYSGMRIPQYKAEIETFTQILEKREPSKWDVKHIAKEFYENIRLHTDI